MTDALHCPECSSENVRFSRKTSSYDCEDYRGDIVPTCVKGLRMLRNAGTCFDQFFQEWLEELERDKDYP